LVVKAEEFLDSSDVSSYCYVALEAIISLAKEKFSPSVICYAISSHEASYTHLAGTIQHITQDRCGPKMLQLWQMLPPISPRSCESSTTPICRGPFEIMVNSLAVRAARCPQNLMPLVTETLTDPQFLKECAEYCGLPVADCWTPVATFTGLASSSFSSSLPQGHPHAVTQVTVFALAVYQWKQIHPLNNALMAMTKLLRHQMCGPCKFFATHPEAGRLLSMAEICGDPELAFDLLPKLHDALQERIPEACFLQSLGDELIQKHGGVHLFMFSWSKLLQGQLEQLVFDSCEQQKTSISKVHRFSLVAEKQPKQ